MGKRAVYDLSSSDGWLLKFWDSLEEIRTTRGEQFASEFLQATYQSSEEIFREMAGIGRRPDQQQRKDKKPKSKTNRAAVRGDNGTTSPD